MHRPATTALLVTVTLLGAACSPQTTTTTTATTAPPASSPTTATTPATPATSTTAGPSVSLDVADQTVKEFYVTVSVSSTVPVTVLVADTDGEAGRSDLLDPGVYDQLQVALYRPAWEPSPLVQDKPRMLTVSVVDSEGNTVASAEATVTLHAPMVDYTVPPPPDDETAGGLSVSQERQIMQTEGVKLADSYVQRLVDSTNATFPTIRIVPEEYFTLPTDMAVEGAARDFADELLGHGRGTRTCMEKHLDTACTYWDSLPELTSQPREVTFLRGQDLSDSSVMYAGDHRWVVAVPYDEILVSGYPRFFIMDVHDGHPVLVDVALSGSMVPQNGTYTVGELAPPPGIFSFTPSAGVNVSCEQGPGYGTVAQGGIYKVRVTMLCHNNGDTEVFIPNSVSVYTESGTLKGDEAPQEVSPARYQANTSLSAYPADVIGPGETKPVGLSLNLPSLTARKTVTVSVHLFPNRHDDPVDVGTFTASPSALPACYLCSFTPVPEP